MKAKIPLPNHLPQRISLVAQTVQILCEEIRNASWQSYLPGERELSERLQVSRDTLRDALEELQRQGWIEEVKPRQRRRIKARATFRKPKSDLARVIALISPLPMSAMSPGTLFALNILRESLPKSSYSLEFHASSACYSGNPALALKRVVNPSTASVWLLMGSREPMERWFVQRQLPCLVLGSSRPDIAVTSIDVDHRAVCRHAGGVLLQKGHRRIALVLPREGYGGVLDCEQGLRESVGAQPQAQLRVLRHDGTPAHICGLVDASLRTAEASTAFLVIRATATVTVMMHLLHQGKRIPQDVAVISHDDDPLLLATVPPVTRYSMPPGQLARRFSKAARQLAETGMLVPKAIRLLPEFVPGETV